MKYLRIISLSIFTVLVCTTLFNTTFAFNSYITTEFKKSSFPDVYTHNTYFEGVEILYKNGVVKGYLGGTFQPEKKLIVQNF